MSAWRKDFTKRKGKISPEVHSDTEWRGVEEGLPCQGIHGRWGFGHDVAGVGWLGRRAR